MATHVYEAEPWAVAGCSFTNAAAPTYVRLPHGDLFSPGSIGPRKSPSGCLVVFAVTTTTASRRLSPAFEKCQVMASAALRLACLQPGPAVWYRCTTARKRSWNSLSERRATVADAQARLSVVHARATSKLSGRPRVSAMPEAKSFLAKSRSWRRVACSPLIQARLERPGCMHADGYVLAKRGAALQRPTRTRGDVCICTAAARTLPVAWRRACPNITLDSWRHGDGGSVQVGDRVPGC
jgi:hypothetical protein